LHFHDLQLEEAVAMNVQHALTLVELRGQLTQRIGLHSPSGWWNLYPAKDGFIKFMALYVRVGPGWKGLVDWMASRKMAGTLKDPGLEDDAVRRTRLDEIQEQVKRFTLTMTREEAAREGQRRGFMIMPINTIDAVLRDEQLNG